MERKGFHIPDKSGKLHKHVWGFRYHQEERRYWYEIGHRLYTEALLGPTRFLAKLRSVSALDQIRVMELISNFGESQDAVMTAASNLNTRFTSDGFDRTKADLVGDLYSGLLQYYFNNPTDSEQLMHQRAEFVNLENEITIPPPSRYQALDELLDAIIHRPRALSPEEHNQRALLIDRELSKLMFSRPASGEKVKYYDMLYSKYKEHWETWGFRDFDKEEKAKNQLFDQLQVKAGFGQASLPSTAPARV